MRILKSTTFLFIFMSIGIIAGFAQNSMKITEFKLDNGLTVFLNEDHNTPEIFGLVITKAGGKNDPKGATGMAHYQEHMLFKGTQEMGTTDWEKEKPHIDRIFQLYDQLGQTKDEEARKKIQKEINEESLKANEYAIPNEMDKILKGIGGTNMNAGTGTDQTMFFNSFPSNQLDKWLELYSSRFINPVFRSFQAELEVVYEEKNLYSDMFQSNLIEAFNKNFFKNHPYGQQTLVGTIDDLKNPSLTKMYEFFKTYYVANNMALVLSGDFNTEEIIPIIKEKFGRWQKGEIPKPIEYKEAPFNGREFVEAKLSPIKLELLGFRTVPNGHKDQLAIKVCNGILSNQNQTGMLDKLSVDNKLLAAMMLAMPYNDHGASLIFVIPKILGQSLEDAEKLVTDQLDSLRQGKFEDWKVEAIKKELYKEYQLSMESIEKKSLMIATAFSEGQSLDELLAYSKNINAITKEDVVRVANQYYGKNYLAFYSKMGFPKKEKIEKPDYKPVVSNTNAQSPFAQKFDQMKAKDPAPKYVDFKNDVYFNEMQNGVNFYMVKNPENDIFSLKIRYGIGNHLMPRLQYASQLMNYAGTKELLVNDLKSKFSQLGCSYSINSDDSYLSIELEGIESDLEGAVKILGLLMSDPKLDKSKVDIVLQGESTNRKMERSEPDNVASALFEFVKYGNNSATLNRMSMKEIKKLNADTLVADFLKAIKYSAEVYFVGKTDPQKVQELLKNTLKFSTNPIKSASPVVLDANEYKENLVYFVNKKKSVQSKVYLYQLGQPYEIKMEPQIDAFNLYFGGDFSGLVLQEIREYRSLAYSAGARYSIPMLAGKKSIFIGRVGTQADKTLEAIKVFDDLVKNMPLKKDRMDMIKPYLIQSALTARPGFRDLAESIAAWKLKGYETDPAKLKVDIFKELTFDDIVKFYEKTIKKQALIYAIVGDKSKIDMKELAKYGKIIEIKEKTLFKD